MPELLQDWLRREFPQAKQTTLRRMLQAGRVRVNGVVVRRLKDAVSPEDKIEVGETPKPPAPVKASLHPLKLVFEDADVLVVDKPAGLLTSTVPREPRPTALAILRQYVADHEPGARLGLIHRLDRDASGLLVFSKTDLAYQSLKQQFFKHTVQRVYTAITHGTPTPPAGRIGSRLVELPDGTVRTTTRPGGGELALTDYETIAQHAGIAAVRVTLQTGRKHQIRAHLSERGVPIVGDKVYGKTADGKVASNAPRLMLIASALEFIHPRTGKPVRFELKIPKEFPLVGGRKLSSNSGSLEK
jgi:23S rRNA pseudouridine1911/1915/1917 synthase